MKQASLRTVRFTLFLFIMSFALTMISATPSYAIKTGTHYAGPIQPYINSRMYLETHLVPLADVLEQMPNKNAWMEFFKQYGQDWIVFIDENTGQPSGMVGSLPWLPGTGVNNPITLEEVSHALGRKVAKLDEKIVQDLARIWLKDFASVLHISPDEIDSIEAHQPIDYLWQIRGTRISQGFPVRDSVVTLTVNHGNIILIGFDKWGDIPPVPHHQISMDKALEIGFNHAGGRKAAYTLWLQPHREWIPLAKKHEYNNNRFMNGYDYRLAWVFGFRRDAYGPSWEVIIDAESGELIALQDTNLYSTKKIGGGVFPVSNDGTPPDGVEQPDYPMPWANTGFPAPNDYTNSAGLYNYFGGTVTTSLDGKYIRINDNCGAISESSASGDLDLGTSGGTDCTVPTGHSAGDTHSSRSGFYELNRMKEEARGWLPTNTWLQGKLTANMNILSTCNAFWDGSTVNFFRSGGGCRNTGEIAAVFDHEWGHGMDDNDTNGSISSPGEAVADMYAAMRLQTSCIGRGFLISGNCGGYGDPCLNCSGVRDIDWDQHSSHTPHTPQNFIQPNCSSSGTPGPCGRETHCEGYIPAEAGFDFATRDLTAPPFNYDSNMAYMLAERTLFLGSGNVTNWYNCSGGGASSDGCGANNGYMQWLAADDDNGNPSDGTPHMTAIYAAYNRHGIACPTPSPTNSGCSITPADLTSLTVIPGNNQADLSWPSVTGAIHYWVFRGEGINGCNFGKVRIADITGTNYTDTELKNGRTYYYIVVPVGSNNACIGKASPCTSVTPAPGPQASFYNFSVLLDTCQYGGPGHNNGIVEPGENVTLGINLENTGIVDLTNILGTLSTTNSWVTVNDTAGSWPNIPIGAIAPQNDTFQYDLSPAASCSSSLSFDIGLTYDQGSNITTFSQSIGGNHPQSPHFVCNVCAQDISPDPAALNFGAANLGTFTDLNLVVRNLGVANLNISSVTPPSAPFSILTDGCSGQTLPPAGSCTISARFAPTIEGSFNDSLNITSDDPDEPSLQVPFTGQGVNPDINVNPLSVDYGLVAVGSEPIHTVTVTNVGAGPLDINPITPPLNPFSFVSDTCSGVTVQPAGSCAIQVKFAPQAPGVYNDSFQIVTNDPDEPTLTVTLTGSGEIPTLLASSLGIDDTAGNSNGLWEPGEFAIIQTGWKNVGNVSTGYLTGTAATTDPLGNLDTSAAYGYVSPGLTRSCTITGDCYGASADGPRPMTHWDVTLVETLTTNFTYNWNVHVGASFTDVTSSHPFYSYIENLLHSSITGGCTASEYCPTGTLTRAQMAIFLSRAILGSDAAVPTTGTVGSCNYDCSPMGSSCFTDVSPTAAYCRHVHYLASSGITTGCSATQFCPSDSLTRGQMAVFLSRAVLGSDAAVPTTGTVGSCNYDCSPMGSSCFTDVSSTAAYCRHVHYLASSGITTGCSATQFCPSDSLTRGQMAVFLVRAFQLVLYGP